MLNSLRNLSFTGGSQPNYVWFKLEADDGEFCFSPATHFIATVEDLTDMPASGSEDIDGIDDDADKEQGQDQPFTGCWTATSLYDVYMVDTPKGSGDDKEEPDANKPSETQSRRRRPKRRSKSCRSKDSNTGTEENSTPNDAENNEDPVGATSEQEEQDNEQVNPDKQATPNDPDDDSYRPPSEDDESLGTEDFIMPKAPLEQERFKRQLIDTARCYLLSTALVFPLKRKG